MADSDKIITVTPNTSVATTHPEIKFVGKDNSPMYLKVLDDNTLSFEGTEGQVFAISPTMSSGDIFSVNDISGVQSISVNADGTITMDAQTKSTTIKNNASDTSTLILENTNADEVDGPILEFYRNTPSPADNGDAGAIQWTMTNDNGDKHEYGRLFMEYNDASDGDERGEMIFQLTEDGAVGQEYMRLRGGVRQIELNTNEDDIDLVYNSDATANFFFINANTQRIGIGDAGSAPSYLLHLEGVGGGNGELFVERTSGAGIHLQAQASYGIIGTTTNHSLGLKSNGSVRLYVEASGSVRIMPEDASSGTLKLSGAATGSDEGGEIQIETAADHDGTYNFYRIDAYQDDLRIGRAGQTDFTLDSSGNITIGGVVDVGNLKIGGAQGSDGQVLTSTGSGVAWEAAGGGSSFSVSDITGATALTSGLASTDELVLSDGGTLKRMDVSVLQTYMQGNLTFTTNTNTMGSGFVIEDGDSTEVTITENKEVKFKEGTGIEINWTDTSHGSDGDPYDLQFTVDVSDFMSNGSNNRVVTATGTDAMNAEGNLTFDGSTLTVTGDVVATGTMQGYKTEIKAVSSNTTLADADSGKTVYWTGGTLTLPATAQAGQQYVVINNTGGSATPALGTSNAIVSGWTAHAAMDDETARTYISPAANKWLYIG
tara:strand:- start:2200 stop:4173 length:1974 start_codon:yes stop_codon:yes gene_type:complete